MSIINDALKKAQNNLSAPESASKPLPKNIDHPTSAPNLQQHPQRKPKRKKIISFFLFLIFLAIVVTYKIESVSSPSDEQQIIIPSPSATKNKYPSPPQKHFSNIFKHQTDKTHTDNTTSKPRLNGTIMMNNHQAALINNNIYRMGDNLNGYEITEISLEGVRLQNEEETIFLEVKNNE